MTPAHLTACWSLIVLAYVADHIKCRTKKWNDDRLLDRATGFFLGAAVVVLFI